MKIITLILTPIVYSCSLEVVGRHIEPKASPIAVGELDVRTVPVVA